MSAVDAYHGRSLGRIRWELVNCNLCGSRSFKRLFSTRDHRFAKDHQVFDVVRCRDCRLVQVNPRPTEADIHRYYHDEFYRSGETPEQALAAMRDRAIAMGKHVTRYGCGRLLDVGCFRGEFMEHMRKVHGWDVAGVEFSNVPPNLFNLDIFCGDLASAPFEKGSFDVVTLWAVLEHVYRPRATLRAVHRFLRPGGTAVILVPNFNSIPARFMHHDDVPRHLTMFTRSTLQRMLQMEGLRPESWVCSQDVLSGSVRGWLNFLVKRLAGEAMDDIQAQNRSISRWAEFAAQLRGKDSRLMRRVDQFDIWLAPRLDRMLDRLGLGFIMVVHARKAVCASDPHRGGTHLGTVCVR